MPRELLSKLASIIWHLIQELINKYLLVNIIFKKENNLKFKIFFLNFKNLKIIKIKNEIKKKKILNGFFVPLHIQSNKWQWIKYFSRWTQNKKIYRNLPCCWCIKYKIQYATITFNLNYLKVSEIFLNP